jgi:transposase
MVVVDGQGVPISCRLASASPAEVKLAEDAVDHIKLMHPWRLKLIADRAYDSDGLRKSLITRGIDLICPHRRGRVRPPTQDGRKLRRYKRRWKVERTFAWLQSFRRLLVRHEHRLDAYRAFFHLACAVITLRRLKF